jgi:hypothetical protein
MESIADVTAIFWPLVEAIITIPYDELIQTRFYAVIKHCMETNQAFQLRIGAHHLVHLDVNGLFYDTCTFVHAHGFAREAALLTLAIHKMEGVVAELDLCEGLDALRLSARPTIDQVDALLAQFAL